MWLICLSAVGLSKTESSLHHPSQCGTTSALQQRRHGWIGWLPCVISYHESIRCAVTHCVGSLLNATSEALMLLSVKDIERSKLATRRVASAIIHEVKYHFRDFFQRSLS